MMPIDRSDPLEDRVTCAECGNRRCEVRAGHVDRDLARRCASFRPLPSAEDRRTAADRWPKFLTHYPLRARAH